MAGNTFTTNPGSGGTSNWAADSDGSKLYPVVKLHWGVDGVATVIAVSAPLPVQNTQESNQMTASGTVVTPKFASISVAASGDNSVVAAVSSKKIRVLSYVLVADAAVAVKWRNGTTDISGAMSFAANGGAAPGYCPVGFFETSATAALQLNLSAAVGVRGHLTYIEV
jgi:hypothetical protein